MQRTNAQRLESSTRLALQTYEAATDPRTPPGLRTPWTDALRVAAMWAFHYAFALYPHMRMTHPDAPPPSGAATEPHPIPAPASSPQAPPRKRPSPVQTSLFPKEQQHP